MPNAFLFQNLCKTNLELTLKLECNWHLKSTRSLAIAFLGRHFLVTHGGTGTHDGTATHGSTGTHVGTATHGGAATHTNIENVDCSIETAPTTIETVDCSIETGVLYNIDNIAVICQHKK